MTVIRSKTQIQPKWPLEVDAFLGPYKSVETAAESLKQDFMFLLLTLPGEWPMNPDLGVGLANYLFEMPGSSMISEIKSKIDEQLKKYLSNIIVREAKFLSTPDNQDMHISILRIKYFIKNLGLEDVLDFGLNEVQKSVIKIDLDKYYGKAGDL